jgi:RNA polymerase subunit RPABC4/transcription elongation factor Spt4
MDRYYNFNGEELKMEIKVCNYCGTELDEFGICPACGMRHE